MKLRIPERWRRALEIAAFLTLALSGSQAVADIPRELLADPGFRPESPHAAAFVEALDSAAGVTIAVHPTLIRRAGRTAHSFQSQSDIVDRLNAAGITAVRGGRRIDLGRLFGSSQWEIFQNDMQRIAEALSGRNPAAQYHLVLEFLLPVSDQEIFGVECYVLDQQGNNAMSFLLNSHHRLFAEARLFTSDSSEAARSAMHSRATTIAMDAFLANVEAERIETRREAALAAGDYEEVVFDDFEAPVPATVDAHGIPVGFIPFTDGVSTIDFSITGDYPPLPGAAEGNHVLRLDMDVRNWAAFAHFFYHEGAASVDWTPYDWQAFDGIAFWLYGRGRGTEFFVDLIDNRHPDATADDAERYVYVFLDNFSGWRRIAIPFSAFVRKEIGNGAPNDGLGLEAVHGWAIGTTNTKGPVTYYVDDFALQSVESEAPAETAAR